MSIATQQKQTIQCSPQLQAAQQPEPQQQQQSSPNNSFQRQLPESKLQLEPQQHWSDDEKSIDYRHSRNVRHVTRPNYKSLQKQTPVDGSTDIEDEVVPQQLERRQPQTEVHAKKEEIECGEQDSYSEIYETPPDYRIYQEAKVNDFFKDSSTSTGGGKPKTISDVCLVNDHYILVKMPSSPQSNQSTAGNQTEITSKFKQSTIDVQKINRPLCQYLRTKRNRIRKITPINEEPEEEAEEFRALEAKSKKSLSKSLHCLKVKSCWHQADDDEVEIYETQTKIHKISTQPIVVVKTENSKSEKLFHAPVSDDRNVVEEQKPEKLFHTPVLNDGNVVQSNQKPQEIQSISGTILMSSLQDRVTLRTYASLVGGQDENNLDLGYCRKSTTPQPRKCPRFAAFRHWFLRPFRGKYRKAKPKIQAVVYKSYFVKWTKPPDILNHGFGGVKSAKLSDMSSSVLRRSRSAIF